MAGPALHLAVAGVGRSAEVVGDDVIGFAAVARGLAAIGGAMSIPNDEGVPKGASEEAGAAGDVEVEAGCVENNAPNRAGKRCP